MRGLFTPAKLACLFALCLLSWLPARLQACDGSGFVFNNIVDNGDGTWTLNMTIHIAGADYAGGILGGTQGFYFSTNAPGGMISATPLTLTSLNGTSYTGVIVDGTITWGTPGAGPFFVAANEPTQLFTVSFVVQGFPTMWNGGGMENNQCPGGAGTNNPSPGYSGTICLPPSIQVDPPPGLICQGVPITLQASSTFGAPITWSNGQQGSTITYVPNNSTTLTATAQNSCGSASASVPIVVTPQPTLAPLPPISICQGETVFIQANAQNEDLITWSNGFVGNPLVFAPDQSETIVVTASNACNDATQLLLIDVTQQVLLIPNTSDQIICQGEVVELDVYVENATNFSWSNGFPFPNQSVSPNETTTYVATASNSCFTEQVAITVEVLPLPTIELLSPTQTICQGQSATLNVYTENDETFFWSNAAFNYQTTVTPNQTTTYIATASNFCGSADVATTVTVLTPPALSVQQGDQAICAGQSATLSVNAQGQDALQWSNGSTAPSITVSPGQSESYTVTATNTCGQVDTTLFIEILPPPSFSVVQGDQDICEGETATLAISPQFAELIQWTGGGMDSTLSVAPTETTTYQVVVSNACGQENGAFTIGVNPLPTIELLQGSQDICAGQSATLAVAAANEDNLVWNTGATSASITLSPGQTTTYTALASNACGQDSVSATINVSPVYDLAVSFEACPRTTVDYAGTELSPGEVQTFDFSTLAGCDSIVQVSIIELPDYESDFSLQACTGSTAFFNGVELAPGAQESFLFTAANGCDSTVHVNVIEVSIIEQDLELRTCPGTAVTYDGVDLFPGDSQSFTFLAQNGCDSIIHLTVAALPTFASSLALEACTGSTAEYNGSLLNPGQTEVFTLTATNGCDSLVTVTVEELLLSQAEVELTACTGSTAEYAGENLMPGSVQDFVFAAVNGCDSTVQVSVLELPVFETSLTLEACTGTTADYEGNLLPPGASQSFLYTAANGCDSTVHVAVQELPIFATAVELEACTGTSADYEGTALQPGTSQSFVYAADNGCDSTVLVSVIELPVFASDLMLEACTGTTVEYDGTILNPGDSQLFVFTAANGCDSTVSVAVQEWPVFAQELTLQACTGFTIDYNGNTLQPGSVQSFTFNSQNGCDSVVTVTVVEVTILEEDLEFTACPGTPVVYNGTALLPGEVQDFTFVSQTGCDSIVTVSIIELPTFASSLALEACTGSAAFYQGTTLFPGDSQAFTLTAANGCDSIVQVTVQELEVFNQNLELSACPGSTVQYAGQSLNPGDSQTFTLSAQNGCDSVVQVSVLQLPTFEQDLMLQACVGATITYQGTTLAPGDQQSFILAAQNGCDSVVNVSVMGVEIFETEVELAACSGTSAIYNGLPLAAGSVQDFTFTSQIGCDSIVTVQVLELPIYEHPLQLETCQGTTTIYNGTVLAPGATQSFTLVTVDGCDSVVQVSVIGVDTIATFESRSICQGDSSLIFGQFQSSAGLYLQTNESFNGCDSTHRLQLNLLPLPAISYEAQAACPDEANGGASLTAAGSSGPYQFSWPDGATAASRADLATGSYFVTATDAAGCRQTAIVQVDEHSPDIEITARDISCFGRNDGAISLQLTGGNAVGYSLDGQNFGDSGFFNRLSPGTYTVFIEDAFGCQYAEEGIVIEEPDELFIWLPPDTTIRWGDSILIEAWANRTGPVQYSWRPDYNLSCTNCNPMVAAPRESSYYYVTARDANGCTAQSRILIYVNKSRGVYIPNVFSPNGDGANDVFHIFADDSVVEIKTFQVYNRWGEPVFEVFGSQPNNPAYGWDGTFRGQLMNGAVFAYFAEIEFVNGDVEIFKGDVTLLR
jgi:gliding motility-associated-like protein